MNENISTSQEIDTQTPLQFASEFCFRRTRIFQGRWHSSYFKSGAALTIVQRHDPGYLDTLGRYDHFSAHFVLGRHNSVKFKGNYFAYLVFSIQASLANENSNLKFTRSRHHPARSL